MDVFKLDVPPYKIKYHSDWKEILASTISEYEKRIQWFIKENPGIEDELDYVFNVFQQPFKNKKVLFIFEGPFNGESPGLPCTLSNISTDNRAKLFVEKLTVHHLKSFIPSSFRPYKSPDVFTWNVSLTKGKDHKVFWKDFSCSILNKLQNYLGIYCFVGYTGINANQDLNLKRTVVLKTESLYNKDDKWSSQNNKVFEIIDYMVRLKNQSIQGISWEGSFN